MINWFNTTSSYRIVSIAGQSSLSLSLSLSLSPSLFRVSFSAPSWNCFPLRSTFRDQRIPHARSRLLSQSSKKTRLHTWPPNAKARVQTVGIRTWCSPWPATPRGTGGRNDSNSFIVGRRYQPDYVWSTSMSFSGTGGFPWKCTGCSQQLRWTGR